MITKSDLAEWKAHPVTKEVFERLEKAKVECEQNAINLGAIESPANQLAQLKGRYDALSEVIDMEADE